MTKRFTISNHCRIKDETQIGFFNIANNIDAKRVCDLLNELNDENEQLKKVFRELITSGYWDDDYLTEQDWNDLKRWIENVFEKVMMDD